MEKNVKISMLCQIYGKLLTHKQYAFLDDYYNLVKKGAKELVAAK